MELLRIDKMRVEIAGKELFSAVSFGVDEESKLALIGANGVGKSVLLEQIFTKHKTNNPQIKTAPGIKISYLNQARSTESNQSLWQFAKQSLNRIINLEKELRGLELNLDEPKNLESYGKLREQYELLDGYNAENNLKKNLDAFGFRKSQYKREVKRLSGGQFARLRLAMVLSESADLLLLDEPTNHLDIEMRQYLKKRLQKINSALLIASHDRDLINAVAGVVLELNAGELVRYKGNYDSYQSQKSHVELRKQKKEKEESKRYEILKEQERRLREIGTKKVQAQRLRMKKELAGLEPSQKRKKEKELSIKSTKKNKLLLKISGFSKKYANKAVLDDVSLSLHSGERIAVVGKNASGKSTLFKMIAGLVESDNPKREIYWHESAKLLYIDQNMRGLDKNANLIMQLTNYVSKHRAEMLLSLVKIPFASWQLRPNQLSGGQKMRIAIALIIASEANILILDEPTNDLDLEMIEILEDALQKTTVAILFASHDAKFVENVATEVWSLKDGELIKYQAGLKGYFAGQRQVERTQLIDQAVEEKEREGRSLEEYELEFAELTEKMFDPLKYSEREWSRMQERYFEINNELSQIYDSLQPKPEPRYQLKNRDIVLYADVNNGNIELESNLELELKIIIKEKAGHLIISESENRCLLSWSRNILVDLLIDFGFLYLGLESMQVFSSKDLSASKFTKAAAGWWNISKKQYEKLEGFR